jgi:hypothetical protein
MPEGEAQASLFAEQTAFFAGLDLSYRSNEGESFTPESYPGLPTWDGVDRSTCDDAGVAEGDPYLPSNQERPHNLLIFSHLTVRRCGHGIDEGPRSIARVDGQNLDELLPRRLEAADVSFTVVVLPKCSNEFPLLCTFEVPRASEERVRKKVESARLPAH